VRRNENSLPSIGEILLHYEQVYDNLTGKLISSALSTPIRTNQELRILTITYSSASPAECKVTVYKL
jgi:hypothetical protein